MRIALAAWLALAWNLRSHAKATEASSEESAAATLDDMKDEFAALMRQRAGLDTRFQESVNRINSARSTAGAGVGTGTATARAYREAVQVVERALDGHPKVKAQQARYDAVQKEAFEVSRQQAAILDEWQAERERRARQLDAALAEAGGKAAGAQRSMFKKAGVKDPEKLSQGDRKALKEAMVRYTNEVAAAKGVYAHASGTNAVQEAHAKDGSAKRFEEAGARLQELEQKQAGLNGEMMQLREELRQSDPVIAPLQRAAVEASRSHVVAMDARPDVAGARAFVTDVNKLRLNIDARARVLRKAILSQEPEYKPDLDRQATAGGLYLAGDDFWK